jgi:enamine deaminase RidA (YjgF/YER057c/UK114 family)
METMIGAGRASSEAVRQRLHEKGLELPTVWQIPRGAKIPATLVRVVGTHVYVSGHVPTDSSGNMSGPTGRVGEQVDMDAAQEAAVRALLSLLASFETFVGDFGQIEAWCRLNCMVNAGDGFHEFPAVFNPASQLLVDLFGEEIGLHARVAVGLRALPWEAPVEIEAEVELARSLSGRSYADLDG